MRNGLPIVASDIPVVREVTDGAVITAPVGDANAFAAAITKAITNEALRSELRSAGKRRATAFSWDHTASQTAAAYQEALTCR
jgi:glycosyltransferase involved in cell wall biosynthesis